MDALAPLITINLIRRVHVYLSDFFGRKDFDEGQKSRKIAQKDNEKDENLHEKSRAREVETRKRRSKNLDEMGDF